MKIKDVQDLGFTHVSKRLGVFMVKKSYFWGLSKSGEELWNKVKEKIPNATLVEYGNNYHDFVGGAKAGSPKDSYFWVKFKIAEEVLNLDLTDSAKPVILSS